MGKAFTLERWTMVIVSTYVVLTASACEERDAGASTEAVVDAGQQPGTLPEAGCPESSCETRAWPKLIVVNHSGSVASEAWQVTAKTSEARA